MMRMAKLHPSAIISPKAKLAKDLEVGPYTLIGDSVTIAEGTKIGSFCVIEGNTRIGKRCRIFTGAVIGSIPQDLKYKGEKSYLEIGDDNIIREYCTLNPGTNDGSKTRVGTGNLFMAYSHIAHDCMVGDHCVFANNATLAGHVTIEDQAVIGGLVAIHQFCRMGKLSIVGGCSKVVQDIPPFATCDGHPARVYGLNLVGLRRAGLGQDAIEKLSQAFKIIFNSGLTLKHAIDEVKNKVTTLSEITYLLDFINNSQRGICHSISKITD